MRDRQPTPGREGRVKIVGPYGDVVAGTLQMDDDPLDEGTPFNKSTMLKDTTAALFGLGVDAVPDDVLAYLGKYAQHWWRRRFISISKGQSATRMVFNYSSSATNYYAVISYSDSLKFDSGSGSYILDNPSSTNIGWLTFPSASVLNGKYFELTDGSSAGDIDIVLGTIYYGQSDLTRTTGQGEGNVTQLTCQIVTQSIGDWEYVQSSDRSAYPDSGEQDGYEYEYLGIPFDNAVGAPKIETGSYVGTGTYGEDNPNSLTFGFVPKVVVFVEPKTYNGNPIHVIFLNGGASVIEYVNGDIHISFSGNSVSWYTPGDAASDQMNAGATNYYYFAIG